MRVTSFSVCTGTAGDDFTGWAKAQAQDALAARMVTNLADTGTLQNWDTRVSQTWTNGASAVVKPRRRSASSARVKLDDQIWLHLHRVGHFIERWDARERRLGSTVDGNIFRNVALW